MYDNKGNLLVKTDRKYKLSCALGTSTSSSGSGSSGSGSVGGYSFIPLDPDDHSVQPISPANDNGIVVLFQRVGEGRSVLTIRNNSNTTVNNWKLYFYSNDNVKADMSDYIIDLGNGIYAIQNLNWDATIEPHNERTVGFNNDFHYWPRALVVEDLMQPLSASDFEWEIVKENYQINLVITNKSGKTIKSWNFEFDCNGTIYSIGKVLQNFNQGDTHYVLIPADNEGIKTIPNNTSVIIPFYSVGSDFDTITNCSLKTFSLTALDDLINSSTNALVYKWTRIGEEIINPGGGN